MKDWWKTFFKPITGEIMFKSREGKTAKQEVKQILSQIDAHGKLKILDLCCGEGRHSIVLAKMKHDVTGLDFSKDFLAVATKKSKRAKVNIKFVRGDMKLTSKYFPKNSFDLVVSLFNSFGYFDKRSDDFETIKEINKILKPDGFLIINTLHAGGVKVRLNKPLSTGYEVQRNVFMIDQVSFDPKKMKTHAIWKIIDVRKKNKVKIFRGSFQQNIYSHQEMKEMLKTAGFSVVKTWGMLPGGEFKKNSWHQTVLAQKTEGPRSRK